ncbi:MAG: MFS transporter [Planctomycetota bacterium]
MQVTPTIPEPDCAAPESSGPELQRNLILSVSDVTCFSLMVGMAESFFPAYVLELGGGEIASGLVTTGPLLTGAILQLVTPWAVSRLNSHRSWVVITAVLQACSVLLLPLAAWFGTAGVPLVFAAVTGYWAAGMSSSPAWNTWIESIVPREIRTRFFALRVRIAQAAQLLGFLIAGFGLQYGKQQSQPLVWFTLVFLLSAAGRVLSAVLLACQSERPTQRLPDRALSLRSLIRPNATPGGGRLLIYLFAVQVAVYISGPYFVPFMFKHMNVEYRDYALLMGLNFIGKVVAMRLWGRFAQRYGALRLLWVGGLAIIPISGLWMISQAYWFLACVQFTGGIMWAAYELAFFLLFFETIPRDERTGVLTVYNLGNSAAQVAGALLGALWLKSVGHEYDNYLYLFFASSVARVAAALLLPRQRLSLSDK